MNIKLPPMWKIKKVKDFSEVITGGTPSTTKKEYWENGTIPWLPSGDLKNKSIKEAHMFITTEGLENSVAKIMPKNTVVVALTGSTTGKIGILELEASANQSVTGILPSNEHNPKYLFYFLQTKRKKILAESYGGAQPHISQEYIKNIEIVFPPLNVQQQIAAILEKVEKAKELREEADELTKDFLNSKFLEMFGSPITNSKKWEVKKMKDLSKKIVSGTTPKGGKKVYVERGTVFFRSQNVWRNRLALDDVAYIDDDTHAKMKKSSLKNKDILMTKTGRINTENSSLGRAAMFLGEDNSANINGHVYLIRLQENIIPEFVLFIITTNDYREYIRSVCVGAIDKRQINKEHLEEFPIIFPPVELQNKFVSIVKRVEAMKEQQKQSRKQIHNLFNHLMQKLFRGELAC